MPAGGFGVLPTETFTMTAAGAISGFTLTNAGAGYISGPGIAINTLRERRIDTVLGQAEYDTRDASRISELWIEQNQIRYLLPQVPWAEACVNDTRIQGFPTYFSVNVGVIRLFPTPNAQYNVGFVQGEYQPAVQMRYASYGGGFSVSNSEAEQKSIDLLKEWLTTEQLADFEKTESFVVQGSASGKSYRITKASSHGVKELDAKGNIVASLCFVPSGAYSLGDIMLAQKVVLEHDEKKALKVANISAVDNTWTTRGNYEQLAETTRLAVSRSLFRRVFG